MLSERDVHSCFYCSQPFCSPFRCSWWFGRTQNKATTPQQGILCGWSGRLEQSTTGHSFGTYYQRPKTCSRHICSLVPTSLTNFPEYEQRTLYGALVVTSHVTAPYKLSFYYYYYWSADTCRQWFAAVIEHYGRQATATLGGQDERSGTERSLSLHLLSGTVSLQNWISCDRLLHSGEIWKLSPFFYPWSVPRAN